MTTPTTVCYRHTDRATRLACSECGRSICVECTHDSAVGQKCPICAGPQQRTRIVRARDITHANRSTTPLTMALIAINVAVFLIGELVPDLGQEILNRGAQLSFWIDQGEWWRGITATFLHGGLMHLAFNMWALWIFGPTLERRFGTVPFGALYLAAGLNGSALYHGLGNQAWAVGASGAIFGLFGALLLTSFRQRHTQVGQAIFSQLALLLGINLMLPFLSDRIAWEAHIGGLIAGVVIAFAWDRLPRSGAYLILQRTIIALFVAAAALGTLILA